MLVGGSVGRSSEPHPTSANGATVKAARTVLAIVGPPSLGDVRDTDRPAKRITSNEEILVTAVAAGGSRVVPSAGTMANRVESDVSVQRFGFTGDDTGRRLQFP